jgi:hypothetical protein
MGFFARSGRRTVAQNDDFEQDAEFKRTVTRRMALLAVMGNWNKNRAKLSLEPQPVRTCPCNARTPVDAHDSGNVEWSVGR